MYEAVTSGEVDVISAFTSDGRIAANDLVVLGDPRGVILPYDAIVLVAAKRAADPVLRRALTPLVDAISVALMREANYRVDRDVDKKARAREMFEAVQRGRNLDANDERYKREAAAALRKL